MSTLSVKAINKQFNTVVDGETITHKVLQGVSFDCSEGDYICISGDSGCGKTTLLNIITGLLKPDFGEVLLDNKPIGDTSLARNIYFGYLPCGASMIDSLTVYENIELAANLYRKSNFDINGLLERVRIRDISGAKPYEISSGEYKRALFARVIALDTPFLILDEPTSNLDKDSASIIKDIISEASESKGIIISTHDPDLKTGRIIDLNKSQPRIQPYIK